MKSYLSQLIKNFTVIQLKYANCIPSLLEYDVNTLLNQSLIIHQYYINRIPVYLYIKEILSKKPQNY